MKIITFLFAQYCNEQKILDDFKNLTGMKVISDGDIVEIASKKSGMEPKKFYNVFAGETSIFNKFTHDKEKAMAWLKLTVSEIIQEGEMIISGYAAQLLPRSITHILTICVTAPRKFRLEQAKKDGKSDSDFEKEIEESDSSQAQWILNIHGKKDPWDSSLYDILLPADKYSLEDISDILKKSEEALKPSKASLTIQKDYAFAAKIELKLIKEGHFVDVYANNGDITLEINKNVLFLSKLEQELKEIVEKIDGVKSVETKVGKDFHKSDVYRNYDFEMPQKVLLVDDEREFVQTLSERLMMRDMGSVVAYDGESALEIIDSDEPEVIILDLRMPGIDGIEVLKRIKRRNKNIEVIMLTGHGSEKDKEICMNLGAFAYLNKPVNIELLSETMKAAYKKINEKKE